MADLTTSSTIDTLMAAADQAGARTALALGTASTQSSAAFDTAGAAAAAQAASQPLDSDLTAIAALATTAFGRAVLALANAAALATYAGVGTGDTPTFASVVLNNPDTSFARSSAGVAEVNNGTAGTFRDIKVRNLILDNVLKLKSFTVATLPSASTSGAGAIAFVTDALTTLALGLGTTVAAGGSNKVPVYSDGTNWIYG